MDIIVAENQEEFDGEIEEWQEVLIHGDPSGLRSLAKQLNYLASIVS